MTPPDLLAVRRYLDDKVPGLTHGPLSATPMHGGRSNLTYELTDGVDRWILRTPPATPALATAHDMEREFRVLRGLSSSEVPMPTVHALCHDPSVAGTTFIVMEFVTGTVHRLASDLERIGQDRTRRLAERSVDTLVRLHDLDADAVGLDDFGRPDGFLERQVDRWRAQLDATCVRQLAGLDQLHTALEHRARRTHPAKPSPTIVHGDFRIDNLIFSDEDAVAAVLDWELSTIGDPYTDLALLLVYRYKAGLERESDQPATLDASGAVGFPDVDELLGHYAAQHVGPMPDMGLYLALACLKVVAIGEGIRFRAAHGHHTQRPMEHVGDRAENLIAYGLHALRCES